MNDHRRGRRLSLAVLVTVSLEPSSRMFLLPEVTLDPCVRARSTSDVVAATMLGDVSPSACLPPTVNARDDGDYARRFATRTEQRVWQWTLP